MITRLVIGTVVLLLFTVPPSACLWCVVQARAAQREARAALDSEIQLDVGGVTIVKATVEQLLLIERFTGGAPIELMLRRSPRQRAAAGEGDTCAP